MMGAKKFQALTNSNLRGNTAAEFLLNQLLKNASISRPYLPIETSKTIDRQSRLLATLVVSRRCRTIVVRDGKNPE
jgi:hypothetical protein